MTNTNAAVETIELALYTAKVARRRAVDDLAGNAANVARFAQFVVEDPSDIADLGNIAVYLKRCEQAKSDIKTQDVVINNLMSVIDSMRASGLTVVDRFAAMNS